MKITNLTLQKKSNRFNIFLNDEFFIGTTYQVVLDLNLTIGKELTSKEIEYLKLETEKSNALESALNYLSRRVHSEKELSQKLAGKKYPVNAISFALSKCKEYGYLNDYEFAKAFIHDKQIFRKDGAQKIKSALFSKGVSKEIMNELFSEMDNEEELERATELCKRKMSSLQSLQKNKQYERLVRYLVSKGFSYEITNKVIKNTLGGVTND